MNNPPNKTLDQLAEEYARENYGSDFTIETRPNGRLTCEHDFKAGYAKGLSDGQEMVSVAIEALGFIANDLDQIGVTPTEISHLAKCKNALAKLKGSK
jgi:hypothetical protein